MESSLIIKNADVITMDGDKKADWICIKEGKIFALGRGSEYESLADDTVGIIDAYGHSVLPGFIDNHFHLVKGAIFQGFISLEEASSFDEIGEIVMEARQKSGENYSPENPILAYGIEPEKLKEGRYPKREDLDRYVSDVPMVLYTKDYHVMMLNTCAILSFQIPYMLPGVIMDKKGIPGGIFVKQAAARLEEHILQKYHQKSIVKKIGDFVSEILGSGVTTIAAMEGNNYITSFEKERESELVLKIADNIPLSVELFYQTTDTEIVKRRGLNRIGGALYLDGTFGSWSAVNSFPYADKKDIKPKLFMERDYIDALAERCCREGLQLSFDAIGDVAVEAAISAFEKQKDFYDIKALRPRIEHCEMISRQQMERAAKLGMVISVQPAYEGRWGGAGGMYEERLGENYKKTNPLREMKDCGLVLCGGSDYNISSLNPFEGIYYSMNHPVKEHSLNLKEALAMYTIDGAYALGLEKSRGSLTIGKNGDVVVLSHNLKDATGEKLKEVHAEITIRDGEIMAGGR